MLTHLAHMLGQIQPAPQWLQWVVAPLNRWLHVVCTTLLVGGTLFYEFVIPKAIEDLKEETQLAVLGRVRWVFRQIVIFSAIILVLSGAIAIWWNPELYRGEFREVQPWLLFHIGLGLVAMVVGFVMMARTRSSRHPLTWLRVNFVILLIVIFLAAITRYVRLSIRENIDSYRMPSPGPILPAENP